MSIKDTAQLIGIAKDAMTGLAAIVAALVAVMGLKAWKRQLVGNANYDLSRRLLRSMYKLREAIKWMRNPFMSAGEMSAAMKAAGLSESDVDGTKSGEELAYQARWQKLVDAQLEFAADVLEAEALWGPSIRQKAEILHIASVRFCCAVAFAAETTTQRRTTREDHSRYL